MLPPKDGGDGTDRLCPTGGPQDPHTELQCTEMTTPVSHRNWSGNGRLELVSDGSAIQRMAAVVKDPSLRLVRLGMPDKRKRRVTV